MADKEGNGSGTSPGNEANNELLRLLLEGYRSGVFSVKDLVPAADVLLPQDSADKPSLITLYDALKDRHEPELMALCETIKKRLVHECFLSHAVVKTTGKVPDDPYFSDLPRKVPTGWMYEPQWPKLFYSLFPLMTDVAFAIQHSNVEGLVGCVLPDLKADIQSIASVSKNKNWMQGAPPVYLNNEVAL